MAFFNFGKKKEEPVSPKPISIVMAMLMYNDGETYDIHQVVEYLQTHWGCQVTDVQDDKILTVDGVMMALMHIPAAIPSGDIGGAAQYAYNWHTAEQDLARHDAHTIVTTMSNEHSILERFKVLTKVNAAILATSNAIGVYQGQQSLLTPRQQYLDDAEHLKQNTTPIALWLYVGMRQSEQGNSLYTYGLQSFGKLEIEIVNARENVQELYGFLSNICAYIIKQDVTIKSGETLGYTATQKVKITQSKGVFVEGQTLKLSL